MSQKTYGEFLEAVLARAEDHNDHAECFIKARIKDQGAAPELWQRTLAGPLTKEIVLAFADSIGEDFERAIWETSDHCMYADLRKAGHEFQVDVHQLAHEFGIDVQLVEFDKPLSPSEALVRSGVLKVVRKNEE
jgi:hypothetical protein